MIVVVCCCCLVLVVGLSYWSLLLLVDILFVSVWHWLLFHVDIFGCWLLPIGWFVVVVDDDDDEQMLFDTNKFKSRK